MPTPSQMDGVTHLRKQDKAATAPFVKQMYPITMTMGWKPNTVGWPFGIGCGRLSW